LNSDHVTELVWNRLCGVLPKALLIGSAPEQEFGFLYVKTAPYDAVVIGLLKPGELFHMPSEIVCDALMEGLPVYYWPRQTFRDSQYGVLLRKRLERSEQMLREIGIQFLTEPGRLVTLNKARQFIKMGNPLPVGCRLTPAARELWEAGIYDRWNSHR